MKLVCICVMLTLLCLGGVALAHFYNPVEPAAPDSIEGQLLAQGQCWTNVDGGISEGMYVQDILEGRLDQPEGRGVIGVVKAVSQSDNGKWAATVDFGRGYCVGIYFTELSPVIVHNRQERN